MKQGRTLPAVLMELQRRNAAKQDIESYDRATAVESIGWQVATMTKVQRKETNA